MQQINVSVFEIIYLRPTKNGCTGFVLVALLKVGFASPAELDP